MTIKQYIPFARLMAKVAQEKSRQTHDGKVPRRILHSALYLLTLGPVSPPSVVADCLTVIAIDLGCNVSTIVTSDKRCVQV